MNGLFKIVQFSDDILLQIFHKKLCASNIVMADGVNPKISGHGISEYCRSQQVGSYKNCFYLTKTNVEILLMTCYF
jgi:hypothetical protein